MKIILPFFCIFLLTACSLISPVEVSKEEVLKRAIIRSTTSDGFLMNGTGAVTFKQGAAHRTARFSFTGSVLPLRHAYSLTIAVPKKRIVVASPGLATPAVPDPVLIDAYFTAIHVDHSTLVRLSRTSFAYVLSVRLLSEAAADDLSISGKLRIDAKTFALLHADWKLINVLPESDSSELLFSASLSEAFVGSIAQTSTGTVVLSEAIFDMILAE